MHVTIDPDLQSLIAPLTKEEHAQLEANLLAEGCRDALVVWQETQTLLDGHNRYELCERHGLTFDVHEISLPDLDAAKAWIIANQLGRRNLTPERMSYFRGEQYNLLKHQGKRTDLTSHHSDGKLSNTVEVLAAHHKVGTATIERDGAYARAIDTIADVVGPEVRQTILARETKLTREGVTQLAELARVDSAAAEAALADIHTASTVKEAREVLARHVGTGQEPSHEDEATPAPARFTELEAQGAAPIPSPADAAPPAPLERPDAHVSVALVVKAMSPLAGTLWAWDRPEPRTAEECLGYLRSMAEAAADDLAACYASDDEDSPPSSEAEAHALPIPPGTGRLHDQLVAALQGHPTGLTTAALAKGLGVRTTDVKVAGQRLINQGLVRYNDMMKVYRLAEPKEA